MRTGERLYFSVRSHAPVWRVFRTSIVQGEGVILITGEPGVGKSHFLNRLKDVLPDNRDMVQILDPTVSSEEFLQKLMAAVKYGEKAGKDLPQVDVTHKQLLDALEERAATGRRLLVAIDQAHMLTDENATLLSILVPFCAQDIKPIQLLLVGRPELWGCLDSEPFKLIRKEVIGSGEITPLTRSEVLDFIHFYIRKNMGRHIRVSWFAWVDIFSVSQGNPFRIEQILARTLALIKLRPRWIITRSLVHSAQQKEQDVVTHASLFGQNFVVFAVIAAVVGVGLFSWLFTADDKLQKFAKIELPAIIQATAPKSREVRLPLGGAGEVAENKVSRTDSGSSTLLSSRTRVSPPEEEVLNPGIVIPPTKEKTRRVAHVLKPREQKINNSWPSPPTKRPHKAVKKDKARKKPPVVDKSTLVPAIKPRKVGSLVFLKNLRPLQVKRSVPVPAPLQVDSQEDRALDKMVAAVQQQGPIKVLSEVGLANSPLPLTTEETLKSAGKIFVVQIGSFLNRDNAERLMLTLSSEGLEPYVHLFKKGTKRWFSVRLNYRNQDSAQRMAGTISKNMNLPARVIELFYE
jgi:type II secretory pathway predicted ATPase ExeA/cell division septation protein DedD